MMTSLWYFCFIHALSQFSLPMEQKGLGQRHVFSSVSDHIFCYSLVAFFSVCLDCDMNNVRNYMLITDVL